MNMAWYHLSFATSAWATVENEALALGYGGRNGVDHEVGGHSRQLPEVPVVVQELTQQRAHRLRPTKRIKTKTEDRRRQKKTEIEFVARVPLRTFSCRISSPHEMRSMLYKAAR